MKKKNKEDNSLKKINESLQCSAKTPSISYGVKDPSASYDWD